jgi:hypothetical protein
VCSVASHVPSGVEISASRWGTALSSRLGRSDSMGVDQTVTTRMEDDD